MIVFGRIIALASLAKVRRNRIQSPRFSTLPPHLDLQLDAAETRLGSGVAMVASKAARSVWSAHDVCHLGRVFTDSRCGILAVVESNDDPRDVSEPLS